MDGRLFGSVTNHDIAEELTKNGYKVAKAQVRMPNGPIKMVGDSKVSVAAHRRDRRNHRVCVRRNRLIAQAYTQLCGCPKEAAQELGLRRLLFLWAPMVVWHSAAGQLPQISCLPSIGPRFHAEFPALTMSAGFCATRPPDRPVAQLRIPPHSIEGRSSVLGGLLLDNAAWDRVGDMLSDTDFYRYEHRLIYAAIGTLINADKPADVITVFEHLQNQGKAEETGGLNYLNALAQYVPSAGNIRRYAEIVRERSILRKLVTASDEIATTAFNPTGTCRCPRSWTNPSSKIFHIGEMGKRNKQGFQSMDTLVVDLLDRVQEMADNPNEVTGVPTGFTTWTA